MRDIYEATTLYEEVGQDYVMSALYDSDVVCGAGLGAALATDQNNLHEFLVVLP